MLKKYVIYVLIDLLPSSSISVSSSVPPLFFRLVNVLSNLGFLNLNDVAKADGLDAECT